MITDKSNRFVAHLMGAVLILILVIFPLATAEETAPDSSQENSGEESSDSESSESSSSEESADQGSTEENSNTQGSPEDSTSEETDNPDTTGEVNENTPESEGLESGLIDEYEEDENAIYYELGEEIPENQNIEPSPEYYEVIPEDFIPEQTNETALKGEVVEVLNNETNTSEFYIELGEILDNDFDIEFSGIEQQEIYFGEPVEINQKITLVNEDDYEKEITINLWNYQDEILKGADRVDILKDDEIISEQPIFQTILEPRETQELDVLYKYPPVMKRITLIERTIIDLLPDQAKVTDSEISINTVIEKKYNVKVYHDGPLHYFNVHVPITELNPEEIKSIYFVEGNEYLSIDSNLIILPKSDYSENSSKEEDVQ